MIDPTLWPAADRSRRIELAERAHREICRMLRLPITELIFLSVPMMGAMIRRNELTDALSCDPLLVHGSDPSHLVGSLVREHCVRANLR
ncbi:MAG: hypothetical protein ACREN8_12835, partial [Candidatus Dormibacteraceae bacterium]